MTDTESLITQHRYGRQDVLVTPAALRNAGINLSQELPERALIQMEVRWTATWSDADPVVAELLKRIEALTPTAEMLTLLKEIRQSQITRANQEAVRGLT